MIILIDPRTEHSERCSLLERNSTVWDAMFETSPRVCVLNRHGIEFITSPSDNMRRFPLLRIVGIEIAVLSIFEIVGFTEENTPTGGYVRCAHARFYESDRLGARARVIPVWGMSMHRGVCRKAVDVQHRVE